MKKIIMFCLLSIFFLHGPAFSAFNFIDNGNGTVTDVRTGLVWLKDADPFDKIQWFDAFSKCGRLASGQAGLTDGSVAGQWRMPTLQELEGIGTDPPTTYCLDESCFAPSVAWTMPGAPFINVEQFGLYGYWSTMPWSNPNCGGCRYYLLVYMNDGSLTPDLRSSGDSNVSGANPVHYVWPVRGPIEITTTTSTIQPTTTTTICDTDYWKNLYEQCQAQLGSTTTTTAQATNIELSTLDATPADKQVILKWKTETEVNNAGFNVWRADNFVKVNNAVIPALGSAVSGSEYDFVDQWVLNGKRYFYLLEDIDTNGISTFHGPLKAVPRRWYGVRK